MMLNVVKHKIWIATTTIKCSTIKLTLNLEQQVIIRRSMVACCRGREQQVLSVVQSWSLGKQSIVPISKKFNQLSYI